MVQSNRLFKFLDFCAGIIFLPLLLYFKWFPRSHAAAFVPRKVLVIKLCCFGDGLLSLLSLQALKEAHPSVRITLLSSRRTVPVFERSPFIDDVITLPISGTAGRREFLQIFIVFSTFLSLRQQRFDVFLDFDVYYRFTTVLGLFCGAGYTAGFETFPGRARLYHRKSPRPREALEWRLFFDMMTPFGVKEEGRLKTGFRLAPNEEIRAREILEQASRGSRRVGIMMGGSPNWPEKRWPLAHFAAFMKRLNDVKPTSYFLFGLPAEQALARELIRLYGREGVIDLTGHTPFPILYGVIRGLNLFVSNDTGPMHLAALSGVPTVGIFGPTTEKKWSPPGRFTALTAENCACRPCYYLSRMPACGDLKCLEGLAPEKVFDGALRLLEGM